MTRIEAQVAAANGAAWLDTAQPDWPSLIDWENVRMWDSFNCIAGQTLAARAEEAGVGNGFLYVYDVVARREVGWELAPQWVIERGFMPAGASSGELVAGWKSEADKRLAKLATV